MINLRFKNCFSFKLHNEVDAGSDQQTEKLGHFPLPHPLTPLLVNSFLTLHIQLIIILQITQAQSLSVLTSPSLSIQNVTKSCEFL